MSCRGGPRGWGAAALLLAIALGGCSGAEKSAVTRIAILPPENLSGDPSLDWAGAALAEVLVSDLTGAKNLHAVPVRSRSEVAASGAGQALYGSYWVSGESLRIDLSLRDPKREKTAGGFSASGPKSGGVLRLGNELARKVSSSSRSFGTANEEALRAYADSERSANAGEAVANLEKALALDPGFGEAWLAIVQHRLALNQRDAAVAAIESARRQGGKIRDIERARLEWIRAELTGDPASGTRALESLTSLLPGDTDMLVRAARAEYLARHFANAAVWFRKAAELETSNPELWNQVLYAKVLAGDERGARGAFERYRKASAENPNTYDSLGEAMFWFGHFGEAEKGFLEAYRVDPAFLGGWTMMKAAHARRMNGDRAGAGGLFEKFIEARKQGGDPLLEYYRARWEYIAGSEKEAEARLESVLRQTKTGEVAVLAGAQLAAWKLAAGDRATAGNLAAQALAQPATPAAKLQAFLCRFAAQPKASPAEWEKRAEREISGAGEQPVRSVALAYALLFSGEHAAAAEILKRIYERSQPTVSGEFSVPLAWSYVESGRREEAKALLQHYAVPSSSAGSVFEFLETRKAPELRRAAGLQ